MCGPDRRTEGVSLPRGLVWLTDPRPWCSAGRRLKTCLLCQLGGLASAAAGSHAWWAGCCRLRTLKRRVGCAGWVPWPSASGATRDARLCRLETWCGCTDAAHAVPWTPPHPDSRLHACVVTYISLDFSCFIVQNIGRDFFKCPYLREHQSADFAGAMASQG